MSIAIGDIPASWEVARLDDVADLLSGGTPSKLRPEWWQGSIPWASPKDMKRLRLRDTLDHISEEALQSGSRLVPAGTIFVVIRGMILAKELPVAMAEVPMAFNQDMKAVLPRPAADPDYLLYAIASRKGALAREIGTSAHGTRRMGTSSLEELLLPLPPKEEQKAIAAVLSKVQAAIEIQEGIVTRHTQLKAATMARLFREGLRSEPLKQTEIGEIPASWAVSRFGDFATLQRGYDLPVHERHSGTIPVVGSNGIVGSHSTPAVKGPGVITGRSGTIGLSFFSEQDFWPLNTALFVSDFHGNVPLFAQYLFENFDFRRYSAGVSVPTLNRNLVHQALLAVPPISEQAKIADILRRLDSALDHATNRRDALRNLFSSMLHQLMTGRVRVTAEMIARERLRARSSTVKKGSGAPDEGKVQEIVQRIVEAVAPEKIILFGSAARGEMGPDSDIDLLVVKACDAPREVERRIYRRLIGIGIPKDIVVVTPGHLEKHKDTIGYIYRPALREGRVIYAR